MPFDATPVRQDIEVTRVLRDALALIEAGWTRKAMARDKWGHDRQVTAASAARFCSLGAINRAAGGSNSELYRNASSALRSLIFGGDITNWNDYCATKKQVVRIFKRAIVASQTVVRYE